jgi:hypothetical protein
MMTLKNPDASRGADRTLPVHSAPRSGPPKRVGRYTRPANATKRQRAPRSLSALTAVFGLKVSLRYLYDIARENRN